MSDSELSEGQLELKELVKEYETKSGSNDIKSKDVVKKHTQHVKKRKTCLKVPMDKVLFGDKESFLKTLSRAVDKEQDDQLNVEADDSDADNEDLKISIANSPPTKKRKSKKRKPVWTDPDDEEIQVGEVKHGANRPGSVDYLRKDKSYKEYLTARFTRIVSQPKWASLDRKKERSNSDDEELLRTVGFLSKSPTDVLTPQQISFKRMKDLNRSTYAEGRISSIQFHPTSTAALVAGEKGIASIYAVDGVKNDKLHNIHFEKFPIKCAKILPCGTKAIFGSIKRYGYLYDLMTAREVYHVLQRGITLERFKISPCGRYIAVAGQCGEVHLFEAKSFELIHSFKQNENVADICFTGDSRRLLCSSRSSNIYIFSLREQRLEHEFIDDGCIVGSVVDLSPNQRLFATGSMEGVVNVYDFEKITQTKTPLPEKCFLNLTTAISDLKFNHSSELLAMSSHLAPNSVKLAHFPSATVYENFPGYGCNLGAIRTMEFSPGSAYLAMGNTAKGSPLIRLKHFKNY